MIAITLYSLRFNNVPSADAGTATLCRFSTDAFHLAGTRRGATPPALSAALDVPTSQYQLLFRDYELSLPSDTVYDADDACAFQEVQLDGIDGGPMLAKLGWELSRRRDGAWLTTSIAWQDFRDGACLAPMRHQAKRPQGLPVVPLPRAVAQPSDPALEERNGRGRTGRAARSSRGFLRLTRPQKCPLYDTGASR